MECHSGQMYSRNFFRDENFFFESRIFFQVENFFVSRIIFSSLEIFLCREIFSGPEFHFFCREFFPNFHDRVQSRVLCAKGKNDNMDMASSSDEKVFLKFSLVLGSYLMRQQVGSLLTTVVALPKLVMSEVRGQESIRTTTIIDYVY